MMKTNSIQSILLHAWDPIGIQDVQLAQDEYNVYVQTLTSLISQHVTIEIIVNALLSIERNEMGLVGDELRARRVAEQLLKFPIG